jgi:hypothetical protein
MHRMKWEVILRILVQESLKSELRLRRYGESKLWGHICNFWMWLGVYLKLFLKIRGASCECVDCGLIMEKARGLFARWWGFSDFGIILQYEMMVDSVHGSWTAGGSVHHGPPGGADWRPLERGGMLAGAWSLTSPELGSSPARVGHEEGRMVKPARRSPGLDMRRDGRATMANRRRQRSSERRGGEWGRMRRGLGEGLSLL